MTGKGPIWAAGTMSGTSLDGVDAAMIRTDGQTISEFGPTRYRAYSDAERKVLTSALGTWDGAEDASEIVEMAHAEVLAKLAKDAEVIGFHGQTVAHEPDGRGTRQLGDGNVLATVLGCDTVWDFRRADIEMGGQGAPLAPFFHFACAKFIGAEAPIAFLNLGGVGNLTWLDPAKSAPEADGACLAFDTGPANAPINDMMASRLGEPFDRDGALAARGTVNAAVLDSVLSNRYFSKMPPKSLDRNDFSDAMDEVATLGDADAVATLTAIAAASAVRGAEHFPTPPDEILVTGGGRHNPVLMDMLTAGFGCPVRPVEAVGLDGDMLEAQAFGYLAVRVLRGLATSAPGTTGVAAPIGGGQVSRAL